MARPLIAVLCVVLMSCAPEGAGDHEPGKQSSATGGQDEAQLASTQQKLVMTGGQLPCRLYGLTERGLSGNSLVAISPATTEAEVIASFGAGADMVGVAAVGAPATLYGLGGLTDSNPGRLYKLDPAAGTRSVVMNTGYPVASGLTARADGTLWTWVSATGLVKIDPIAKTAKRALLALSLVKQLVWVKDELFVFSTTGQVYKWKEGQSFLTLVTLLKDLQMGPAAANGNGKLLAIREPQCLDTKVTVSSNNPSDGKLLRAFKPVEIAGLQRFAFVLSPRITSVTWPIGCGTTAQPADADLIRNVSVTPATVCAGAHIDVAVTAQHPDDSTLPVEVQIQGQPGNTRSIQVTTEPGTFIVAVTANTGDRLYERELREVTVVACPTGPVKPMIVASVNPVNSRLIDLRVQNHALLPSGASYEWAFGDGSPNLTTPYPYAAHDFLSTLKYNEKSKGFLVRVTARPGTSAVEGRSTVTVHNDYAILRDLGRIQLPATGINNITASSHPTAGIINVRLKNLEPNPVTFTSQRVRLAFCDGTREPSDTVQAVSVALPALAEINTSVTVPGVPSLQAQGVCTASVHYEGTTTAGPTLKAASHHYVVVEPPTASFSPVTNPGLLGLLNSTADSGLLANPLQTTDGELRGLAMQNRTPFFSAEEVEVLGPDFGDRCYTGDTPPRAGLTCQTTNDWEWRQAYIANAMKGDSVTTSACSFIAEVMSGVSPRQFWTHVGMMTKNHNEIRNSTGTDKYMEEFPIGVAGQPSDGFKNHATKYLWPGTITQSVFHAYYGEYIYESFTDKDYKMGPFSQAPTDCDAEDLAAGTVMLVRPQVIRPPLGVSMAHRARLHEAADQFSATGAHYRFFAYSNAAAAADSVVADSAEAPWSRGTRGLVCSTAIWDSLKRSGMTFEGVPEATDPGGEMDGQTLDGLYFYDANERANSGANLWRSFYNKARNKGGFLGKVVDAPEDIADQLVHCFAEDRCDSQPGADWHGYEASRVGVGRTVSPDQMFNWDSPALGGPYGESEELIFVVGDYRRVQRWAASGDAGSVSVVVTYQGDVVPNAAVEVNGVQASTDGAGVALIPAIPAGSYDVDARVRVAGELLSGVAQVDVVAAVTSQVEVQLAPPPSDSWIVDVAGSLNIVDDEPWPADDEHDKLNFTNRHVLTPLAPVTRVPFDKCVGDEVSAEGFYELKLSSDFSRVDVSVHVTGWENTGCGNNDNFDRSKDESFTLSEDADFGSVGPTEQHVVDVDLTNHGDSNGGDTIKGGISFTITRALGLSQLTLENFRRVRASGSATVRASAPSIVTSVDLDFNAELFVSTLEPRVEKTFYSSCKQYATVLEPTSEGGSYEVKYFARAALRLIAELQPDLSVRTQRIVSARTSIFQDCSGGTDADDHPGEVLNLALGEAQPQWFTFNASSSSSGIEQLTSSGTLVLHNEQAPTTRP